MTTHIIPSSYDELNNIFIIYEKILSVMIYIQQIVRSWLVVI